MKKLIILLILTSCANNKISPQILRNSQDVQNIIKNGAEQEFSKRHIFAQSEIILRSWIDKNGNSVAQYSHSWRKNNLASYVPIISFFMPRHYNNYEIIVVFDKKSKKPEISEFFGEIKMDSAIFCNPPAFSCLAKIN